MIRLDANDYENLHCPLLACHNLSLNSIQPWSFCVLHLDFISFMADADVIIVYKGFQSYQVSPECAKSFRGKISVSISQIARFKGPTWDPPGSCRPQVGPMLAPWTLQSGIVFLNSWVCVGCWNPSWNIRSCLCSLLSKCWCDGDAGSRHISNYGIEIFFK